MALYALDDIDDAVEATKRFLLPFDRVRWFRLAVVMFFVGGAAMQFPTYFPSGGGGDVPQDPGAAPGADPGSLTPELTGPLLTLIVGGIALLVVLGLAWAILAATMEFVFVDSLRQEEVRLRRYVKRHWRRGARLFVFRTIVGLLSMAAFVAIGAAIGASLGGWPPTGWTVETVFALVLAMLPVALLFAIVVGNFLGFTTMFVVPVMLAEDRAVLSAWRRFWPTMVGQWKQYVVYAVLGFMLNIGVGMAAGFLGLLALIVIAIPFAIVGIPLVVVLGLEGAGALVALVLGTMFVVVMLIVGLLIQVPFQTFLRYYALLVLGDTEADFDVIPDAREAVRADGGDGDDGPGGATTDRGNGGGGDGFDGRDAGADRGVRGGDETDHRSADAWDVGRGDGPGSSQDDGPGDDRTAGPSGDRDDDRRE